MFLLAAFFNFNTLSARRLTTESFFHARQQRSLLHRIGANHLSPSHRLHDRPVSTGDAKHRQEHQREGEASQSMKETNHDL